MLASGDTFAVFDRHGELLPGPGSRHGLYVDGARFLSGLGLRIDGHRPLLLSSGIHADGESLFVHEANPDLRGRSGPELERDLVHLARRITLEDAACSVELVLRSYADSDIRLPLELEFAADYADVFEVRGSRRPRRGDRRAPSAIDDGLLLGYAGLDGVLRETRIQLPGAGVRASGDALELQIELPRGRSRTLRLRVECTQRGSQPDRGPKPARHARGEPRRELAAALVTSSPAANAWLRRSAADLSMLAAQTPEGPMVYAGVPWFCTPFGRDALITAYEVLWLDPGLARGVLRFLAARQADRNDPTRDAEPGKILHELRRGEMAALGEVPFGCYYGSVDATPLFGLLAAAYHERTADDAFLESLWPHLERALAWIDGPGDADGDGFVEYLQRSRDGLGNQGWKDSRDAIVHEDGSLARGPIALCEVQAYVYGAKLGLARVARSLGRSALATQLEGAAERLRAAFEAAFWCEELGSFALALDGDKRPCRVSSSNAGHALLTGLAAPEHAERIARTLLGEDHFSGWGVRTLAESAVRYNPMAYHNGSVWPHDNALLAAGLARYGDTRSACAIFTALFDACRAMEHARLPELICGFERSTGEAPTLYPVACSPQAWAAGSVFLCFQAALGLSVDARKRQIRLSQPCLPAFVDQLTIYGLEVGEARADLLLERSGGGVDLRVLRRTGALDVVLSSEATPGGAAS